MWAPSSASSCPFRSLPYITMYVSLHLLHENKISARSNSGRHILRHRVPRWWGAKPGSRSFCGLGCFSAHDAWFKNSKQHRKDTTCDLLHSGGLFQQRKVIRILLWHRCVRQKPGSQQLVDEPLSQSSPGNSHSDVMFLFPPVRRGQQWEGGWGLHHIIFPQRGRPAAYSCLMAPSCHMASQPAATQERQMLSLHKDL